MTRRLQFAGSILNRRSKQTRRSRRTHRKLMVEGLEDRRLLTAAATFMNDNWHFGIDLDNSGTLTVGDVLTNANDTTGPGTVAVQYGITGFGVVTTGPGGFTGSLPVYDQINEAIAGTTAGGTLTILEGTYTENVTLNKSITVKGQQAGVDARGRSASETILTGSGLLFQLVTGSAGSVIDGLTFDGGNRGIESTSGPIDNLVIRNNQFLNLTSSAVFLNDNGVDITVHQNMFDGASAGSGGVFHLDQDNFDGFHFTSNDVLNGATGFFVDGTRNVGQSAGRDPLFEGNRFEGNLAGANFGRFGVEYAIVRNNVFTNNDFDGLQGGIQNSTITQNEFSNNDRAGLRLTGFGGTGDSTRGALGNSFTNNVFFGNGDSADASGYGDVRLDDQFDGTIDTNTFFNNSFGSTVAVFNNESGGGVVDFSGNWWGSNGDAAIAAKILGAGASNIDFTPFLDTGTDTDGVTPGFQGDFSVLHVTTLGAQKGSVGRVQEGVNLVTASTVLVHDGVYVENVTINKDLALLSVNGRAATTIQGIANGALGTIRVTNNTTAVEIGRSGQGLTIIGIDNPSAGLESAAVYFQGSHSGAKIVDNEIQAAGDAGLLTEFGATISGFEIDGNEFSGQTFIGPNPADYGFANQFTVWNVPRQLVLIGSGGGAVDGPATNITFTNNQITGTAGGFNISAQEQGNTLVTLDVANSTISDNTFTGTTTRFATSLRVRRPGTTIENNDFNSSGLTPTTGHLFVQNSSDTLDTIARANGNTWDKGVYVDGNAGTIGLVIQGYIDAFSAGTTIYALAGTYNENVDINKAVTLKGEPTITGTLTLSAAGATLSPGFSPGIVASGNLALTSGSVLALEINGTTPGTEHSQVAVTGTVNLGGATLNLSGSLTGASEGDTIVLIDNDGVDLVVGQFTGYDHGDVVVFNSENYRIFYNRNGNDVVLVRTDSTGDVIYVDDDWVGTPLGDDPDGAGPAQFFGFDSFATIQEGVNAVSVSGTVIVNAGTYTQKIVVSKNDVTLQGANAGLAYDESRLTPSIIQGDAATSPAPIAGQVTLIGSGITVDGFDLQLVAPTSGNPFTYGIRSFNSDNVIQNNIITGLGPGSTYRGYGIAISQRALVDPVPDGNIVRGNQVTGFQNSAGGHGINIGGSLPATNTVIEYNDFSENYHGIYVDRSPLGTIIRFNNVSDNLRFGIVDAEGVGGNGGNTLIQGNTVTGNGAGVPLATLGGGIQLFGTDATVTENFVEQNTHYGILVRAGFESYNPTPTVLENSIVTPAGVNNRGLRNDASTVVNASASWWGSNDETIVTGLITGLVDFTPYLNTGTDTALGTDGFQGDFSTLIVTDAGQQTGAVGRIQEAINLVTASTVILSDGSYTEDVTINKSLTLKSVNGAAATTVTGVGTGYGGAIEIASGISDVTLGGAGAGISVVGTGEAAVYLVGGNSDVLIEGNTMTSAGGKTALLTGGGLADVTVEDNTFTGSASQMVYVNGEASLGAANSSANVDFVGNVFTGSATGPLLGLEAQDSDVTGNTFSGSSAYAALELWGTNVVVSGNTLSGGTGVGILVNGPASASIDASTASNDISGYATGIKVLGTATIADNDATISGNTIGIHVDGGTALIENNDLTGNTVGIRIQNGGLVDAGDVDGANVTGLGTGTGLNGSSAGGNVLSGYTGLGGNFAIENLNLDANSDPDVEAENNDFGTTNLAQIEQAVFHDVDNPIFTFVDFVPVETPPPPAVLIIDNSDPGFSIVSGTWGTGLVGYKDSSNRWNAAGTGTEIAEWTFGGLTPGLYRVSATWVEAASRATDSPFTIVDFGVRTFNSVRINQELAPNDFNDAGAAWEDLGGLYPITSTSLVVRLTDAADDYVIADAIRVERVGNLPPFPDEPQDQRIDNSQVGFSVVSGSWGTGLVGYLDTANRYNDAGSGSDVVEWTFTGLVSGLYQIAATWVQTPNRATNSPFTVIDPAAGKTYNTVNINQKLAPNDFADDPNDGDPATFWEILGGLYNVTGSTLTVRLTDAANEYVIADAIGIKRVGDAPPLSLAVVPQELDGSIHTALSRTTHSAVTPLSNSVKLPGGVDVVIEDPALQGAPLLATPLQQLQRDTDRKAVDLTWHELCDAVFTDSEDLLGLLNG